MSSGWIRLGFSWEARTFAAQKAYKLFTKLWIKPDFPSLADEIAEPRPDMNIKVAAFTVSVKSINILLTIKQLRRWPDWLIKEFTNI